ncbi:hypothetical protein APS47_12150 [Leptospira kirschneri serovar Mozdok]|nr:hypothetical protein APS47_12150 [Leptospira kirschneri serovar Mozdok]
MVFYVCHQLLRDDDSLRVKRRFRRSFSGFKDSQNKNSLYNTYKKPFSVLTIFFNLYSELYNKTPSLLH